MIDLAFAIVYWAVLFTAGAMVAVVFVAVCLTFKDLLSAAPPPLGRQAPQRAGADVPLASAPVSLAEYRQKRGTA